MFIKNLLRRKIRTLLTVLGIGIGVAAIVALGAMADGLGKGYNSMLTGSKADLVLSQPNTYDISYSAVDEEIGAQLLAAPEVSEVSGMLQGFVQAEGEPFFFVFGYPEDSFALGRFQIVKGIGLDDREARQMRGKPILLGSAAAEILDKSVGDSMRITGSAFRVVGLYETGDAFEDSGALLPLSEAQELLGRPRQVSLFYIRLKDPTLKDRFTTRVERRWPNLSLSGIQEFADSQALKDMLMGYVWAIGLIDDIKRVFGYHGAEHKAINAYEQGVELKPERVTQCSIVHPRCGTAFLLIVMVISILVFALVGNPALWIKILSRILLIPVIAGIAYEFLKFSAAHQANPIIKILIAPGLALQRMTTREPDLSMLEVSIAALKKLLAEEQLVEERAPVESGEALTTPSSVRSSV